MITWHFIYIVNRNVEMERGRRGCLQYSFIHVLGDVSVCMEQRRCTNTLSIYRILAMESRMLDGRDAQN